MRLLLDTHAFLRFAAGSVRLPVEMRDIIADRANTVFLSMASVWEMAIKVSLGKLAIGEPFELFLHSQFLRNHIELLPITVAHTILVAQLAFHHRDPFDRLIIAQSLTEQLTLISADSTFDAYTVSRRW